MALKIGYVLGTPVEKHEIGKNTGFLHMNPPPNSTDRTLLHITRKDGFDFCRNGGDDSAPLIGKKPEDLAYCKMSIDKIYKAVLNDSGDDILYLTEELA